jgi:serine O-acetyltransferase
MGSLESVRRGGVFGQTIELLKEDLKMHQPRAWLRPGFHALAAHRIGRAAEGVSGLRRRPLRAAYLGLAFFAYVFFRVELPTGTTVGRRLKLAHQGGMVIASDAVIGDDCLIRQNVTIGAVEEFGPSPRLGDRVRIGAGAVLLGDITIGDDVLIGPNAVVTTDVPAGAKVVAPAARVIAPPGRERSARTPGESTGSKAGVDEIVSLVTQTFAPAAPIDADTPLLSSGLIDSLKLALLIDVIESSFGVSIPSEKVAAGEFDTPRDIAAFLTLLET